jgi:microcystin-dependent protein
MTIPKFVQAKKTTLKQGITDLESNSILLKELVDIYGNALSMTDFGSKGFIVFNPGGENSEIVKFTDFTVNTDGSVRIDTGIERGRSAVSPYEAGGEARNHASGTVVVVSNTVQLYDSIIEYIGSLVIGEAGNASKTTYGITRLTHNMDKPRAISSHVSESGTPDMKLYVHPFAVSADTEIVFDGGESPTFTAPVTDPRIDLLVYNSDILSLAIREGVEDSDPVEPQSNIGDIVLASVYHRVGETSLNEIDDATNGYIKRWYFPALKGAIPSGIISPYVGKIAPSGYLMCDGQTVSRSLYASLFNTLAPSQTFTVTIANPAVFTTNSHGLVAGDKISFTTTGGLPTGLATNTDYYVISTGLTTDAFRVSLSPGGAAIETTGSQSGQHTLYLTTYGKGDGSTTFNVPDLRSRIPVGYGTSAPTTTLHFQASDVDTGNDTIRVPDLKFPSQGQKIRLTTTGTLPTGLSAGVDYFVIRASSTTIKLASSQANANAGTAIDITGAGAGVSQIEFTNDSYANIGKQGGEENHGESITEMPAHAHPGTTNTMFSGASGFLGLATGSGSSTFQAAYTNIASQGGNTQHNNMQPYIVVSYIIKT